jgi:Family of unknown function (DUF6010)
MIEISPLNYGYAITSGTIFILLTGLIPEAHRRNFHAIVVAAAAGTYLGGGLGKLEPVLMAIMVASAFFGLNNWRFIGLAWFFHGSVDLIHHFNNDPLIGWYAPSSFECFIVDWYFAIWFAIGAPNFTAMLIARRQGVDESHPRRSD